jgi:ABC-type uncharacterized transport system substrate-binding protein
VARLAQSSLLAGLLLASTIVFAQAPPLVILYPDVPEPERSVFRLVREGVAVGAAREKTPVASLEVTSQSTATEIEMRLRAQAPRAVIVLGRRAFQLTESLSWPAPHIVGGVELAIGSQDPGGISLVPDPRIVLETLREVTPRINRVAVVLDPSRNGWLQQPAEQAARALGLELQVYRAQSVGEAAARYLDILRSGNPRTDALWLLDSGHFVTTDTLPAIVEESWSREFVVFSNVAEHVRQGVLFAHYLDPISLGERLANEALTTQRAKREAAFLQDTRRAGNVRVARHLGAAVDMAALSRFDLVLGKP